MTDQDRLLLIAHALGGSAVQSSYDAEAVAKRAIEIADAVVRSLEAEREVHTATSTFERAARELDGDRRRAAEHAAAAALLGAVVDSMKRAGYAVVESTAGYFKISVRPETPPFAHVGIDAEERVVAGDHSATAAVPLRPVEGIGYDQESATIKRHPSGSAIDHVSEFVVRVLRQRG